MNFELTDDQTLIRNSLSRYLREQHGFEARSKLLAVNGHEALWQAFAQELGILGAPFPVETGGFGGGAVEVMVVMEALGEALVVSPYLETVVLAGSLLRQAGGAKALQLMGEIAAGDQFHPVCGEAANAKLWPLQVGQDRHRPAQRRFKAAHRRDQILLRSIVAVAHVHPKGIGAGFIQGADLFGRAGSWPQRCQNTNMAGAGWAMAGHDIFSLSVLACWHWLGTPPI